MERTPCREKCECGGFIKYNFNVERRQCKGCKKLYGKVIGNKARLVIGKRKAMFSMPKQVAKMDVNIMMWKLHRDIKLSMSALSGEF